MNSAQALAWAIAELPDNNFYHDEDIEAHDAGECDLGCPLCRDGY